ncbi:hypothetical protein [Dysgonomonas mossii]|uniref:hypothetical protein n=1 Tax=Dysgonomonas mossii TaxID=163665 RepID=UPI00399443B3
MEIIFLPKDISSEDMMNEDIGKLMAESKDFELLKRNFESIDKEYDIKSVNLGKGADFILLWALFTGLGSMFLMGDKIEKNIEAWSKIGKRIKKILKRSNTSYIDRDAAIFLCIDYLYNKYKTTSIQLRQDAKFSLDDLSQMMSDRESKDFIANPYSVYFFHFEINNMEREIICVRSDGKLKCLEKYNDYNFFF